MYWGVIEEASLAGIARGVTDHLGEGRTVVHGPWDPAACSARLVEWFDRGLIELYDAREGHPTNRPDIPGPPDTRHGPTGVVPAWRTRELLADWQHWGDDDDLWLSLRLVVTDRGMQELGEPAGPTP